jgi:hypothetical protein
MAITIAAAMIDTGIVTAGISVARMLPRNTKMTTSTMDMVSASATTTFFIDSRMNTELSMFTSILMSSGSVFLMRSISALDRLRHFEHVRLGQRLMPASCQAGPSLVARDRALVLGGELHGRRHRRAAPGSRRAAPDHQAAEILLGAQRGVGAQRELALLRLDAAGRQFDVLAAQRILEVGDRELPRRQRLAIEPDAHGIAAAAIHAHRWQRPARAEAVDEVAIA